MNNIEKLIANYRYKHPLAEKLGGEFIMQCDEAQIDAIQLVCDIFELKQVEKEFEHLEGLLKNHYKKEPCEDCISRAEAQTEIEMNASRYTIARERGGMGQVEWSDQLIKVSDAVDTIRHLPSVTPQEPKTGHWIMPIQDDGMSDSIYYQVRCSECDFDIDPQSWFLELHKYGADKYCPKCGAKMVEPHGSELENPFNDNRFGG